MLVKCKNKNNWYLHDGVTMHGYLKYRHDGLPGIFYGEVLDVLSMYVDGMGDLMYNFRNSDLGWDSDDFYILSDSQALAIKEGRIKTYRSYDFDRKLERLIIYS